MLIALICFVAAIGVAGGFLWLGPIDQASL